MKKTFVAVLGFVAVIGTVGCSVNVGVRKTDELKEVVLSQKDGRDKLLILPVDGIISLEPKGSFFSKEPSVVAALREQLDLARTDDDVKGLILRINSPGGTLGATQMIYDEIAQFRKETGIYVLALYMEVAASGALYISMASDQIMAYPSALTGSMGVVFISPNFEDLGKKIGVEYRVVKSGMRKDMGTPFRSWPAEERKMLEALIVGYNDQFKEVVFNNRKGHGMQREQFETLTDARVVSAEQALKLRLIDEIGTMSSAIANVEKKNGRGRMKVVAYTRYPDEAKTLYYRALGATAGGSSLNAEGGVGPALNGVVQTILQASTPNEGLSKGFYYLW